MFTKAESSIFFFKIRSADSLSPSQKNLGDLLPSRCDDQTAEKKNGKIVIRRIWIDEEIGCKTKWYQLARVSKIQKDWSQLKLVIRRQTEVFHLSTQKIMTEERYFITNMDKEIMTVSQIQMVIRDHWGVENNCHCVFDKEFEEDKHHFIENPKGTLSALLLSRLAYTILALSRHASKHSKQKNLIPWKELMRRVLHMLHVFDRKRVPSYHRLYEVFSTS